MVPRNVFTIPKVHQKTQLLTPLLPISCAALACDSTLQKCQGSLILDGEGLTAYHYIISHAHHVSDSAASVCGRRRLHHLLTTVAHEWALQKSYVRVLDS